MLSLTARALRSSAYLNMAGTERRCSADSRLVYLLPLTRSMLRAKAANRMTSSVPVRTP